MRYPFDALVDLKVLANLCQKFTQITGAVTAVLDLEGKVLIATGWQDICTKFHRRNPLTAARCTQSDTTLANQVGQKQPYNVSRCQNGLIDVATPIVVDGVHLATLFTGQFFFQPPDREFFRRQAAQFGFEEEAYLKALDKVPIFTEEQVWKTMDFFGQLAQFIAEKGMDRMRLLEAYKQLSREVQEREMAEAELARQRELLRNILNNIPTSVFWKDRQGRFLGCNRWFAHQAGAADPQELVGKSDQDLPWAPEEIDSFAQGDQEVLLQGRPLLEREETLTTAQGEPRTIVTSKVPLRDGDGEIHGILGTYYDITERKLAERERDRLEVRLRQAHKLEAVGTLAGGIAHDFNNILAAITGYAELALDDEQAGHPNSPHLEQIILATQKAKGLVSDILTFSRKSESDFQPLDPNQWIEQAVKMLERTIPRMVSIELDLAPSLPAIQGDSNQIQQMLLNLGSNARDAMPQGGVLSIATRFLALDQEQAELSPDCQPGPYVLLEISDTGVGMDSVTLEHIFEPFYTTKEVGKGTGLGLAMVYGIVKNHQGCITCQSQPGQGSTIRILLPALPQKAPQEAGRDAQSPDQLPGGRETVLVVDDEQALRDIGQRLLSRAGYSVRLAASGEEALDIFGQSHAEIDMVLLDISMPGMGGLNCLEGLLEIDPQVRVLMASGYARQGAIGQALASGAAGYVAKPYGRAELLGAVRRILDA